jgi:ribosome-binding factor A
MENTRLKKVNRLLQNELGVIFQRESKTLFGGAMITVTEVSVSPDLSVAKVYISLFLTSNPQKLFEEIKLQTPVIRKQLGMAIRHQLRIIPELIFIYDDSLDRALRIEELLKK